MIKQITVTATHNIHYRLPFFFFLFFSFSSSFSTINKHGPSLSVKKFFIIFIV